MNLKFLDNPAQRLATGRSMPLKKLEAVIVYGSPVQRTKVVKKVLPQTYILSLDKATHYILLSILKHCDNLVKVEMLYHVRRKVLDLARSRTGNVFLQELIEKLPAVQKKEIAEAFVLNVDEAELADLCRHEFGNHVAQKLLEYPASAEVIEERLLESVASLATDQYGQRVVAKMVSCVAGGAEKVVRALFGASAVLPKSGDDDDLFGSKVEALLEASSESYVLCALLKSIDVAQNVKDAIVATLAAACDDLVLGQVKGKKTTRAMEQEDRFAGGEDDFDDAVPDFAKQPTAPAAAAAAGGKQPVDKKKKTTAEEQGEEDKPPQPRHTFTLVAALENGDAAQREMLADALCPTHLPLLFKTKGLVEVAVALYKYCTSQRQSEILRAFFGAAFDAAGNTSGVAKKKGKTPKKPSGEEALVSASPSGSSLASDPVTTLFLRAVVDLAWTSVPSSVLSELLQNTLQLARSPIASPVLQRLLAVCDAPTRTVIYNAVRPGLAELAEDACGVFLVQSLLDHLDDETRQPFASQLVDALVPDLQTKLATTQGSRLLQKALAFATDDSVKALVQKFVEESLDHENDETEEPPEPPTVDEKGKKLTPRQIQAINKGRHYAIRRLTVQDFALHHRACYAVQAMLRECRARQLVEERRLLMNELKKSVYDLAMSPWAGRVVLDTMLTIASKELSEAIRNVVFLKVESWLSEAPASTNQRGSADPTMRKALRRNQDGGQQQDGGDEARDKKKLRAEKPAGGEGAEKPKKQTKIFRSMKK